MNLIIEQEGKGPIEIFQAIPAELKKYLKEDATPVGIKGDQFKALFQEFKGLGFSAWHNSYWMTAPVILKAKGPEAVLELRIALRSMIRGTWDKMHVGALPKNHFQMGFAPYVLTRAIFDLSNEYETFDIHFELFYLESLGFTYKLLDQFINNIHKANQAELSSFPHHCTPRMMDHILGVLHNNYSPEGKQTYLKQAVEIILFEALEEVCRAESTLPKLNKVNTDKIYDIKALIEADCPEYRGNEALCQAAGINQFYLHIWFKELFNKTPKEHYLDIRFMQAKKLLSKGQTAASVAYELGYTTPAAFGAEFKKHFGYTPKEYQKGKL